MKKSKIVEQCVRRLEGMLVIIGMLADVDDKPELEIVHDDMLDVILTMKAVLDKDVKDLG